jgi:hypothetical protein
MNKPPYTETCKKYSVTVIFYYIFHIKLQFFKTLFESQFLFDFDDSLIKIIPQTQFSYRRGLTGMAYRSSSRDLSIV